MLNYNVQGSVNYTIVGTPTIVDGVVSGFSNSGTYKYLQVDGFSFANSFDINCKFQYKTIESGICLIAGIANENGTVVLTSGGVRVQLYSGNRIVASHEMIENGWYSFKYTYDGDETYTLSLYDENETLLSTDTKTSTTALPTTTFIRFGSVRASSLGATFTGSIDLNNTYIKVNGQAWFGVCPVEVKHIDYGTSVGYTIEGSPTITNGVLTGLTNSTNGISLPALPDNINSFEFVTKVKTRTSATQSFIGSLPASSSTQQFIIANSSASHFFWNFKHGAENDTDYRVSFDSNIPTDTELFIKATMVPSGDNYLYTLGYSSDGETYTSESVTSSYKLSKETMTSLQMCFWSSYSSGGATVPQYIDLNQTYIKVNGKLWFFRPACNYLIKDGKLIWADSDVYIDDNGTKTYASANIAPVPSGFTYGNTTTSDVGLVDMTTQTFTAVPGATWGKDAQ